MTIVNDYITVIFVFYNIKFGYEYFQMLAKKKKEKTAFMTEDEKY